MWPLKNPCPWCDKSPEQHNCGAPLSLGLRSMRYVSHVAYMHQGVGGCFSRSHPKLALRCARPLLMGDFTRKDFGHFGVVSGSTLFCFNCVACCCTQHHPWFLKTGTLLVSTLKFDRILVKAIGRGRCISKLVKQLLAWPPLQSLAVRKNFYFVEILGGEKLLKFVEKCR